MKFRQLNRKLLFSGLCIAAIVLPARLFTSFAQQGNNSSESEIQRGLAIAPVYLNLQGKNRALVATGSYLVNGVGGCNDCHTNPSYIPGPSTDPFLGGSGAINVNGYLAGGRAFGPFVSRNLTPDVLGRPAGLTFADFRQIIRTGIDDDNIPPNVPSPNFDLLQVMPWPVYRNMTDNDLRAIYEYLSAIPCIPTSEGPGGAPPEHTCT